MSHMTHDDFYEQRAKANPQQQQQFKIFATDQNLEISIASQQQNPNFLDDSQFFQNPHQLQNPNNAHNLYGPPYF